MISPLISFSFICYAAFIAWLIGCAWPITEPITQAVWSNAFIYVLAALTLILFISKRLALLCLLGGGAFLLALAYSNRYVNNQLEAAAHPRSGIQTLTILDKALKKEDKARYQARLEDGNFIFLTLPRASPIAPGNVILTDAPIHPLETKNEQYRMNLLREKIIGEINYPSTFTTRKANLNLWEKNIIAARTLFEQESRNIFWEPQSSLFMGLVAGITADIPENIRQSYKITGLSHLIAVSGFNVTIVMTLLSSFTKRFGRWQNTLFIMGAISFFIVFTGGSSSVTRAGIMAALALITGLVERKCTLPRAMIITAVSMTIANPLTLRYDIGFQLSFAALAGLFAFAAPLQRLLQRIRLPPIIGETLAATTAAQLTTIPITGYYFASLSPYSLLANLLVGPVIPFITAFGIPLVFVSRFLPWLTFLGLPFELTMRYTIKISHLLSKLPFASATLPPISAAVWVFYYFILYVLYKKLTKEGEGTDSAYVV